MLCRRPLVAGLLTSLLAGLLAARTLAVEQGRYHAEMDNGERVVSDDLKNWGEPNGMPHLAGRSLLDPNHPARCLIDTSLSLAGRPKSYVELVSGDRLPGSVVLASAGGPAGGVSVPAHLVVTPSESYQDLRREALPRLRVDQRWVRRIVWQRRNVDRYEPSTLFYRDGRELKFRGHRLESQAVYLLLESGAKTVSFDEIAELHLPQVDAWEAYVDELAVLSPDLKSPLVQLETTGGLVATTSAERLVVPGYSDRGRPDRWYHLIQPAWSLEAFSVRNGAVAVRRIFRPHEVPLSRIAPSRAKSRSSIGPAWPLQRDRNAHGGPLDSGGLPFAWGLGMHGRSAAQFPLPPMARWFNARLGLDRDSGTGGCARGQVGLRQGDAHSGGIRELYRSDVLVGSERVVDTGPLQLGEGTDGQSRWLILGVDPMFGDRPQGADPFDLRDALDWLHPVVGLDQTLLAEAVRQRTTENVAAWRGWTLQTPEVGQLRLENMIDAARDEPATFRRVVRGQRASLTLARTLEVGANDRWLLVSATRPDPQAHDSRVQIRVNGAVVAETITPYRELGKGEPRPLVVPLGSLAGQKARLEIVQQPKDDGSQNLVVDWRTIAIMDELPLVHELLEDQAVATRLDDTEGQAGNAQDNVDAGRAARLVTDEPYAGASSLSIPPGGAYRLDLGNLDATIRNEAGWGEYEWIRFAFRKRGGGGLYIQYDTEGPQEKPLRHDAGRTGKVGEGINRQFIFQENADVPDSWVVVTRHLFADLGYRPAQLKGIRLGCVGGESAEFDHIYLARSREDLDLVSARRIATPDEANRAARRKLAKAALDKALPAVVQVRAGKRSFTGTTVGPDGYVVTAGHVLIGAPEQVGVVLADGREVKAKTLGTDRTNDLGLLKILDQGTYPFLEATWHNPEAKGTLLLAVAHAPNFKPGERPLAYLTVHRDTLDGLFWTNFEPPVLSAGGPLVSIDESSGQAGKLVGLHVRDGLGGYLYLPIAKLHESLQRLNNGERWGEWPAGSGPTIGVWAETIRGACVVTGVVKDSEAERAGLAEGHVIDTLDGQKLGGSEDLMAALGRHDPGQQVSLKILRNGVWGDAKITLGRRR